MEKSGETGIIKEGEIAFAKFLYYRKDSVDIDEGVKDNVTSPSWYNEKENELESSVNVNTPGTKEVPELSLIHILSPPRRIRTQFIGW